MLSFFWAHAGSSSTSMLTCWGTPANDYGAPITAYHLEVSPVPPRQKSAPSWQRAYSGIATTCEVSPCPFCDTDQLAHRLLGPAMKRHSRSKAA